MRVASGTADDGGAVTKLLISRNCRSRFFDNDARPSFALCRARDWDDTMMTLLSRVAGVMLSSRDSLRDNTPIAHLSPKTPEEERAPPKSRYVGVVAGAWKKSKKTWVAQHGGELGRFPTELEAAEAYCKALGFPEPLLRVEGECGRATVKRERLKYERPSDYKAAPKSRYVGVTASGNWKTAKNKWQSTFRGKYVGTFATEEEAAQAHADAKGCPGPVLREGGLRKRKNPDDAVLEAEEVKEVESDDDDRDEVVIVEKFPDVGTRVKKRFGSKSSRRWCEGAVTKVDAGDDAPVTVTFDDGDVERLTVARYECECVALPASRTKKLKCVYCAHVLSVTYKETERDDFTFECPYEGCGRTLRLPRKKE